MLNRILLLTWLCVWPAAGAELEEALAPIADYEYHHSREPLLAFEKLARSAPPAAVEEALASFLGRDSTRAAKDYVCRRLSLIGTEKSVPALARLLRGPETVEMARYALERIPGDASLRALREALAEAPEQSRPGIVNTLGARRDEEAVPALAKLAAGGDPELVGAAVAALGRIASSAALTALRSARVQGVDGAEEAMLVAAELLVEGNQKERAIEVFTALWDSRNPRTRVGSLQGRAQAQDPAAVEALAAAMRDPDPGVGAAAAALLAGFPGAPVTKRLLAELATASPAARVQLLTALSVRGDPLALPAMRQAADDPAEEARMAAILGLARLGDAASVPMLTARAASESALEAEREASRHALARATGEAVDGAILEQLADASGAQRIELLHAAAARGISSASPDFFAAARDPDRDIRRAGFRALRETAGDAEIQPLLALLGASKGSDRREAERALAAAVPRSSPARVADVIAAYRSADSAAAKSSMLQVMGLSGSPEVLPVVREALESEEAALARGAILALTEWPDPLPMPDLLGVAKSSGNPALRVLAHRGYLQLFERPNGRSRAETVQALAAAMDAAPGPDEKKAVLGLLPRYPVPETLAIAEAAGADPDVAAEAKLAVDAITSRMRP